MTSSHGLAADWTLHTSKNHDNRLQIMPNSKSATKRLRQNVTHRDRNRAVKSDLRTQLRKVRAAVAAGDVAKAEAEFEDG